MMNGESSAPNEDLNVVRMPAKAVSVQVVCACPCGEVLVVHQIGGKAPIGTQCPKCQNVYSLATLIFEDHVGGQRVRTAFKVERPAIVRATGPLRVS